MAYKVVISQALPIKLFKFESYLFVFIRLATMVTTKKGDFVTFLTNALIYTFMLPLRTFCVTMRSKL